MSYRTVKRLLGETSLERKCRFLFGGGLMLLISGSFYVYARMTSDLVYDQTHKTAEKLIYPIMVEQHIVHLEPSLTQPIIERIIKEMRPKELQYKYRFFKPDVSKAEGEFRPSDAEDGEAHAAIVAGAPETWRIVENDKDQGEYHYFTEIRAQELCAECHKREVKSDAGIKAGDLMGVVKVVLPLEETRQAIRRNNAILIATAIVTACLAMGAAYLIVRYVIVKPVLHLKDVSDQIARGNLDLRAEIRTGDEYEEFSHAFNRMLRHLVSVQDELRVVNTDLDGKVDQLAQVNLRLYEMNKLKDDFLATMSHELRTPLNSILGFSDILARSDNLTERQKRFVKNIVSSGASLMVMINDLLDLAKIESGKMEVQTVECSLLDLIERQVGSLNPLAEKKNIDFTYDVDPALPLLFQDSVKLQQILNNLLSNAIKFTPEGGRVRITARPAPQEGMFEIVVEDTGIGIPLNEQATIFEKFRQGHTVPGQRDAITREFGGTGLGLSIVKELTKLLGGEVAVVSEFGRGSTFTVRLPLRLDDRPSSFGEVLVAQSVGVNRQTPKYRTGADDASVSRDETTPSGAPIASGLVAPVLPPARSRTDGDVSKVITVDADGSAA